MRQSQARQVFGITPVAAAGITADLMPSAPLILRFKVQRVPGFPQEYRSPSPPIPCDEMRRDNELEMRQRMNIENDDSPISIPHSHNT